jgi:hypothetical protein
MDEYADSEQRPPYPRASTSQLLPNSEWKPFADLIEQSKIKKTIFERICEYLGI